MRAIFKVCAEIYKEWLVHANGFVWGLFIGLEVYENLVNDSFHTIIWKYLKICPLRQKIVKARQIIRTCKELVITENLSK